MKRLRRTEQVIEGSPAELAELQRYATGAPPAGRTPVQRPRLPRESASCRATAHGTYSAYRRGCRCPDAREKWRLHNKQRREGRSRPRVIDATGTGRRLRALAALGWPMTILAGQLGFREAKAVSRLCQPDTTRVNIATAAAVRRLYERLSMTLGPSARARVAAERSGWLPPLAWNDGDLDNPAAAPDLPTTVAILRGRQARRGGCAHAAIERACDGRLPVDERLNQAERIEVVRRLHRVGLPDAEVATRARTTVRSVQRDRRRLQLSAGSRGQAPSRRPGDQVSPAMSRYDRDWRVGDLQRPEPGPGVHRHWFGCRLPRRRRGDHCADRPAAVIDRATRIPVAGGLAATCCRRGLVRC